MADLAMQYGEAGKRLVKAIRRRIGQNELIWDTWERLRNLQRILGYMREAPRVPPGTVVFLGSSSVFRFPLQQLFPGAPVLNRGLGAESVTDTLRRLRWTMPVARPAGVIVWAGANDLRALALDPLVIVERVARLLDAIRARFGDVAVTILGVPPWCDQTAADLDRLRRLNDGYAALAFARGVTFLNLCRAPLTNDAGCMVPEMADADRKHLGLAGYEQLAQWILDEGGEAAAPLAAAAGRPAPTPRPSGETESEPGGP